MRLIHKCHSTSDFRWIGGNSLNFSSADFLYPSGLVVLDCSSPCMTHHYLLSYPMHKASPIYLSYVQKTVLHDHFRICKNSFYWLFIYKSLIYVQFGRFCSRNHLDSLVWSGSPLSSDVDWHQHTVTHKLIYTQQELPGWTSRTFWNSCLKSCCNK